MSRMKCSPSWSSTKTSRNPGKYVRRKSDSLNSAREARMKNSRGSLRGEDSYAVNSNGPSHGLDGLEERLEKNRWIIFGVIYRLIRREKEKNNDNDNDGNGWYLFYLRKALGLANHSMVFEKFFTPRNCLSRVAREFPLYSTSLTIANDQ